MKNLVHLLLLLVCCNFVNAQENQTAPKFYQWKNGKSVPHDGYIVLKSGKQLVGTISLKGSYSNVEELHFEGDGKEIKFPMAALSAYGLTVAASQNETAELFEWKYVGVVMGKETENTKPRAGYVVDAQGNRYTGQIQLVKHDGVFTTIKIKTSNGKKKFTPSVVASYGCSFSIDDLTKGGTKTYKDNGRNFHQSTITYRDGSEKKGWGWAFRHKAPINQSRPGQGTKWLGIYYTQDRKGLVELLPSKGVKSVVKQVNSTPVKYTAYADGFILPEAFENKDYKDATKEFNAGSITLVDGTVLLGQVAQIKGGGRAFPMQVRYKKGDEMTAYDPQDIKGFQQMVEGKNRTYFNYRNKLVEIESDGTAFRLFRNPFPTSTNRFLTGLTSIAVDAGTTAAASKMIRGDDGKVNDFKVDSILASSSTEDLMYVKQGLIEASKFSSEQELMDKSQNEQLKKYVNAINLELAGREAAASVEIKNKEWIIENKKTGEQTVFYKGNYKEQIEPILMGCYTFLSLEKKDQRPLLNLKAKAEALKLLNECY